ncbi:sialate O-acetylesterase [Hypomesus transpacificus]|uniref:sialate O-acetylesterase n=1 Tax=Hypomesus transpacificus TaxID=137520 RepID=UPI001F072C68|nr:sialate O-acetylesterase [Hypomesus transpacificus]
MSLFIYVCFLSLWGTVYASDLFRFASYYGDHMVLQKSPESAVLWGYGPDAAMIFVSVTGPFTHKPPPTTVSNGIWKVSLDPVGAGGPYNVTVFLKNGYSITLTDVLFGDVWLCGGQSNMAFTTSQVFNASSELALASKYPQVRVFMAALEQSNTELTDLAGVTVPWSVPTPELLGGGNFTHFSAVCWLFGRYLYKTLRYPVGLVESCWGGTPVEAWSSPRALHQCGLDRASDGIPVSEDTVMLQSLWRSSVLWNAMIHPLLNMTLKGAIWYQGEANTQYHQEHYSCAFPTMIYDWRMSFHQSSGGQTAADFPFGFVQLSTYRKSSTHEGFPSIRWQQTADYGFAPNPRMKRTFMAVAMDLPDETSPWGSIHPRDKQDVSMRLTLGARAVAYGEREVSFQGPFPNQVLVQDTNVNVTYDQRVSVNSSKDIFEICCSVLKAPCWSFSNWVPAPIIQWDRTSVQLSTTNCQSTNNVAGLRYAWRDWPCDFKACPIYTADGVLPAPPFTLNRWPFQSMNSDVYPSSELWTIPPK